MSRKIDDNKPYSDEDRAYLHGRSLDWKIEVNNKRFGTPSKSKGRVALSSEDVPVPGADVKPDAGSDTPVVEEDVDLSGFNQDLVNQIVTLDDKALSEELEFRGVVATGSRKQKEKALLEKVDVPEAKGK